jgi:alpha-glucosidase
MHHVPIALEQVRDPLEKNVPGQGLGRDGARTPMQWDGGVNAGFSTGRAWLPLAETSVTDNVEDLAKDGTSILNLYRRLIALRRATPALTIGSYRPIVASGDLLLFGREHGRERILIALNLAAQPIAIDLAPEQFFGRVLVSTLGDRDGDTIRRNLALRGHEGVAVALPPDAIGPAACA